MSAAFVVKETKVTATEGLPSPRRYWAIAVVWVGLVMSVLDGSIVNVALPTLAHELNATAAQSIWVINAYQLGSVMLLLPLAACGEIVGYRRIYLGGMAVFSLASVICIFAPTLMILAIGRGLQGVGAAGIMGMNAALIRHIFPARLLGRTLGANAFIIGVSTAAAPTVASAILALATWRWLFAVNIPFCVFALALGAVMLPASDRSKHGYDFTSAVLNAASFGALVLGADMISRGEVQGWGVLALAVACALILLRRSLARTAPLFPIDLLRIPLFGLSIGVSTASFCAQLIAAVTLPFLFQRDLHRTVVETGLLMTPWPIGAAVASAVAGVLSERTPSAILNSIGLLVMAAGLLFLAFMPQDVSDLGLAWRTVLCGAGFGFFQSPNNRTMVLAAPRARSGAAGGALATARTIGQSLGAVMVALFFRAAPLAEANRWALGFAAALGVGGAAISVLRLGRSLPPTEPAPEIAADVG
jgi:DHA2 family multidrug resistance protein-like MFS transporter